MEAQKDALKTGRLATCCSNWRATSKPPDVDERQTPVRRCHRYLSDRRNQLNYKDALAKDLPIGSGEIESAHRYIAQQRLKRPGASWRVKHAEYMLALRITPQKRQLGSLLGHGRQTPLPRKGRKSEPANRITTNSSVIAPHWIAPASLHPYVARLQPLAQRRHDRDFIGPAVDRAGFDELAPYRSEEGRRRMSRRVAQGPTAFPMVPVAPTITIFMGCLRVSWNGIGQRQFRPPRKDTDLSPALPTSVYDTTLGATLDADWGQTPMPVHRSLRVAFRAGAPYCAIGQTGTNQLSGIATRRQFRLGHETTRGRGHSRRVGWLWSSAPKGSIRRQGGGLPAGGNNLGGRRPAR